LCGSEQYPLRWISSTPSTHYGAGAEVENIANGCQVAYPMVLISDKTEIVGVFAGKSRREACPTPPSPPLHAPACAGAALRPWPTCPGSGTLAVRSSSSARPVSCNWRRATTRRRCADLCGTAERVAAACDAQTPLRADQGRAAVAIRATFRLPFPPALSVRHGALPRRAPAARRDRAGAILGLSSQCGELTQDGSAPLAMRARPMC
jgi:hypothetical protein